MDRIAYAEVDLNVVWRRHESFSEFCAYTGLESCRIGYERSFYPGRDYFGEDLEGIGKEWRHYRRWICGDRR
jgi:hypothetical protein